MKVINGNNIDILKQYPDNYFDAVVTDPPYGLGKEPNAEELMKDWIEKGYHEVKGGGFMGKEWDAFVPQPIFWKEVFRVLKHGGHVVSFFGTRTYDWGVMAMRFAGFEVRDCIQWLYGSGFPKSHNISKAIDKMYGAEREVVGTKTTGTMNNKGGASVNKEGWDIGQKEVEVTIPATDQAKQWEGWGSALKPAHKDIVLARKPLEKGLSIAENVLKWGTGAINIDGCRVGTNGEKIDSHITKGQPFLRNSDEYEQIDRTSHSKGRFPANLILSCSCENEDEHHEDCPIKILDEQSGESKSTGGRIGNKNGAYSGIGANGFTTEYKKGDAGFGDKGGASRFFQQCNFEENDILFCYLCAKSINKELWESNYNNVLNVKQTLRNTKQTKEHIALKNVTQILKEKADHLVKSVENLCPLCVTNFVQQVVEINNLDSKKEQLNLIRDFTQDYKKCTLLQSLVFYVETMENIDTTPTTQNLLRLFGYALIVIENYISKDIKEKEEQKSEQNRFIYQPKASKSERNKGLEGFEEKTSGSLNFRNPSSSGRSEEAPSVKDMGGLTEKRTNFHPTVKPIKLMQYLSRLITPPNGIVLDPFCGSGTTGIACKIEGFNFIGIEQDLEYSKIAEARINNYMKNKQQSLF